MPGFARGLHTSAGSVDTACPGMAPTTRSSLSRPRKRRREGALDSTSSIEADSDGLPGAAVPPPTAPGAHAAAVDHQKPPAAALPSPPIPAQDQRLAPPDPPDQVAVREHDTGEEDPAAVRELLASVLSELPVLGSFALGGVAAELPALKSMRIHARDDKSPPRTLQLPVNAVSAEVIKALGCQAPYGQGEETMVDTAVRNSWQLEPSQVQITYKPWRKSLNALVKRCVEGLGSAERRVVAKLYKALLYEVGGHFKPHTDTEKADGMFATLTITLPSRFTGGALVAKQGRETQQFDFGAEDGSCGSQCHFAALYADVEHEVQPLKSGYRFALVYSVCWVTAAANEGLAAPPVAPPATVNNRDTIAKVARLLAILRRHEAVEDCKLLWLLDHQYTPSSLNRGGLIASLKGADAILFSALRHANELLPQDVRWMFQTCTLSKKEQQYSWHDNAPASPSSWENACVDDEWSSTEWRQADGASLDISLDITCAPHSEIYVMSSDGQAYYQTEFNELFSEDDSWTSKTPGRPSFTGNEGATRELTYQSTMLVAWPVEWFASAELELACQSGHTAAIQKIARTVALADPAAGGNNAKHAAAKATVRYVFDFWIHSPDLSLFSEAWRPGPGKCNLVSELKRRFWHALNAPEITRNEEGRQKSASAVRDCVRSMCQGAPEELSYDEKQLRENITGSIDIGRQVSSILSSLSIIGDPALLQEFLNMLLRAEINIFQSWDWSETAEPLPAEGNAAAGIVDNSCFDPWSDSRQSLCDAVLSVGGVHAMDTFVGESTEASNVLCEIIAASLSTPSCAHNVHVFTAGLLSRLQAKTISVSSNAARVFQLAVNAAHAADAASAINAAFDSGKSIAEIKELAGQIFAYWKTAPPIVSDKLCVSMLSLVSSRDAGDLLCPFIDLLAAQVQQTNVFATSKHNDTRVALLS
eukprot:COSAG02_NODE_6731_length_3396_cov_2.181074_2_plen_932_part_01